MATHGERMAVIELQQVHTTLAVEKVTRDVSDVKDDVAKVSEQLNEISKSLAGFRGGGYAVAGFLSLCATLAGVLTWMGFSRGGT